MNTKCKYNKEGCQHPECYQPMDCHRQNCPWDKRQKNDRWWKKNFSDKWAYQKSVEELNDVF